VNPIDMKILITAGLIGLFLVLEHWVPARPNVLNIGRFSQQALLAAMGAVASRLALGGGLAGVAVLAEQLDVGLFNIVALPSWTAVLFSFLMMDFAIWAQHLAMHHVPFLWRLHRVHHSDTTMDVSTALRFHPFEILASLAFKIIIILLLGAPAIAVIAFEIVLSAGALFTHANVAVPSRLEALLRLVFVTPALHLIHHSPDPKETNSNFGFSFSFWDRIFGTYRRLRGDANGPIGLESWRLRSDQTLPALLLNPFK
jgi:sterol desaturase/sphingolipid hydroxylase (fatty acid hydroxylase superfamily)